MHSLGHLVDAALRPCGWGLVFMGGGVMVAGHSGFPVSVCSSILGLAGSTPLVPYT